MRDSERQRYALHLSDHADVFCRGFVFGFVSYRELLGRSSAVVVFGQGGRLRHRVEFGVVLEVGSGCESRYGDVWRTQLLRRRMRGQLGGNGRCVFADRRRRRDWLCEGRVRLGERKLFGKRYGSDCACEFADEFV